MKIDEGARELLGEGTATVIATRDERMRPALARGWAVVVSADGSEISLCVAAPEGSAVRANLEQNGAIAITCSSPATYRTVQAKGEVVAISDPTPEELAAVDAHVAAFSRDIQPLGLPRDAARRLLEERLVTVRVRPRELFDQTPGPNAGTRM